MRRWLILAAAAAVLLAGGCWAGARPAAVDRELPRRSHGVKWEEPGFSEVDPKTWSWVRPLVQEYMYYRKKAVISGDVNVLWERYPHLKSGVEIQAGINAEENHIKGFAPLRPMDGDVHPEGYERFKVKVEQDEAQVILHGWELYLRSNFEQSGGEFVLKLFLRNDGARWTLVKTDEVTQLEYHHSLKKHAE